MELPAFIWWKPDRPTYGDLCGGFLIRRVGSSIPKITSDRTGAVPRLQMIMRLRRDTGVNLAGIGMILDLLDPLRALERENQWLRAEQ